MNSSFKPPRDQSLITRVLFLSSFTLFIKSLLSPITRSDFSHLRSQMQLQNLRQRYNNTKSTQHRYKLFEMFKYKIIIAGACAVLSGIITAYLSYLIKRLITYISSPTNNSSSAYSDLVMWSIFLILKINLIQNSFRIFSQIGIQCQVLTQTKILTKIANIPLHQKHGILKSEVLSVYIIQVKRIHSFFKICHLLFLSPTSCILAVVLIFYEKWYLGFVVIHAIVLVLIILYFIQDEMNIAKSKKLKQQRLRINTNIQLISQLKELKNLGWQGILSYKTNTYSKEQNKSNAEISYLNQIYELILILIPILVFSLMFLLDYMSGEVGHVQYMNVSQIYILINFINLIHSPLRSVRVIIAGLYDFRTALNKIQSFFDIKDNRLFDRNNPTLPKGTVRIKNLVQLQSRKIIEENLANADDGNDNHSSHHHVFLEENSNQHFAVEKKIDMKDIDPQIRKLQINFDITVNPGEKLIILDSNNQGSTLLASLAGLIDKFSGTLDHNGKLGYVPSKYWFAPTTIKDNIIFGQEYSKKLLEESIYNADLSEELKMYNHREWTNMKQDTFSVSQLNRIAYARALYSKPDILLLDDTFRTMNRATVQALNHRIKQKLINKTFIIVTDSVYCIGQKDHVLVFENGKAVQYGKYIQLLKNSSSKIHRFIGTGEITNTQKNLLEQKIIKQRQKQAHVVYILRSRFRKKFWIKNLLKHIREQGLQHVHKMMDNYHKTKEQHIVKRQAQNPPSVNSTFSFYRKLFSYCPTGGIFFTYLLITISQTIMLVLNWFLGYMARRSQQINEIRNTVIFFVFTFVYVVIYFVQSYLDTKSIQQACNNISTHMFDSISKTSPSNFQNTPLTVTTDKLNQDYYKIFTLFSRFSHASRNTVLLLGTLILITIQSPNFLLYGIPLAIFNVFFFLYLHRYQNQIAKQHSSFSSASLSSVEQIFDGIETHKFYGNPSRFINQQLVNFYNYGVYRNQERQGFHLISFISQISSLFLVWYIASYAIRTKSLISMASVVYLGTSISYSIKVSHILSNINRQIIQAEVGIIKNMKKIFDYIDLPPESNYDLPGKPKNWPKIPQIKLNKISVRRNKNILHRSLKDFTLDIKPKQRVLIFGRGTSGVYSIFPSIMKQLTPIKNLDGVLGNITVNDIDIAFIGKKYLIEQFFHLTPTPFIFTSTLLDNIDPFQQFPKHQIIKLLSKLNIQHFISAKQKDLLDYPIILQQTPQALKHLINICRAILRNPSLLLCQSIQTLNGIQIQSLLSHELNYSTMMFINPHLSFIKQADRIVFVSHGRIIQNDAPIKIFQNQNSKFAHDLQNNQPLQFIQLKKTVSSLSSLSKIQMN